MPRIFEEPRIFGKDFSRIFLACFEHVLQGFLKVARIFENAKDFCRVYEDFCRGFS